MGVTVCAPAIPVRHTHPRCQQLEVPSVIRIGSDPICPVSSWSRYHRSFVAYRDATCMPRNLDIGKYRLSLLLPLVSNGSAAGKCISSKAPHHSLPSPPATALHPPRHCPKGACVAMSASSRRPDSVFKVGAVDCSSDEARKFCQRKLGSDTTVPAYPTVLNGSDEAP